MLKSRKVCEIPGIQVAHLLLAAFDQTLCFILVNQHERNSGMIFYCQQFLNSIKSEIFNQEKKAKNQPGSIDRWASENQRMFCSHCHSLHRPHYSMVHCPYRFDSRSCVCPNSARMSAAIEIEMCVCVCVCHYNCVKCMAFDGITWP